MLLLLPGFDPDILTRHAIQWMPFSPVSNVLLPQAWLQEAVPLVTAGTKMPTNRCDGGGGWGVRVLVWGQGGRGGGGAVLSQLQEAVPLVTAGTKIPTDRCDEGVGWVGGAGGDVGGGWVGDVGGAH